MSVVRLNAVGDVWFGDHPVRIGHGVGSLYGGGSESALFAYTKELLAEADINFCNLESVLSDAGLRTWWLPSLEMRGRPSGAEALADAGFNVVSMANNHMMQHGAQCYVETAALLERHGMSVIGREDDEGYSELVRLDIRGARVALMAFSLRPEEYFDGKPLYAQRESHDQMLWEVTRAKAHGVDFLVCSLHWGTEYMRVPDTSQIQLARQLIDAGVDVVLGHHPHVLQGWEIYRRGLVLYSLGNFVFDLWPRETRKAVVAHIELRRNETPSVSFTPVWIDDAFRPTRAVGEMAREIQEELREISEQIGNVHASDLEYKRASKAAEREVRLSGYRYFARNLHRYPPNMLMQSIGRTLVRRITGG